MSACTLPAGVPPLYSVADSTAIERIFEYLSATRGLEQALLPFSVDEEWNAEKKSEWVEGVLQKVLGSGGEGMEEVEGRVRARESYWRLRRVVEEVRNDGGGEGTGIEFLKVRELIRGLRRLAGKDKEEEELQQVERLGAEAATEWGMLVLKEVIEGEMKKKGKGWEKKDFVAFVNDLFEAEEVGVAAEIEGQEKKKLLGEMEEKTSGSSFKRFLTRKAKEISIHEAMQALEKFLDSCHMGEIFMVCADEALKREKVRDAERGLVDDRENEVEAKPGIETESSFDADEDEIGPVLEKIVEKRDSSPSKEQEVKKVRKKKRKKTAATKQLGPEATENSSAMEDDGGSVMPLDRGRPVEKVKSARFENALIAALPPRRNDVLRNGFPATQDIPNDPDQLDLVARDVNVEPADHLETLAADVSWSQQVEPRKRRKTALRTDPDQKRRKIGDKDGQVQNSEHTKTPIREKTFVSKLAAFVRKSFGTVEGKEQQELSPSKGSNDSGSEGAELRKQLELDMPELPDVASDTPEIENVEKSFSSRGKEKGSTRREPPEDKDPHISKPTKQRKQARPKKAGSYLRMPYRRFMPEEDALMDAFLEKHGFGDWKGMLAEGRSRGLFAGKTPVALKDRARSRGLRRSMYSVAEVSRTRGRLPGGTWPSETLEPERRVRSRRKRGSENQDN